MTWQWDLLPCAILVPSLGRPHRLEAVAVNIHSRTPEPHRLIFCVADDESKAVLDGLGEEYVDDSDTDDHRYVTRMNRLLDELKDEPTVFFGSDDVVHHHGWLSNALDVMAAADADVVVVNDLHNQNGTQAVVRRDYLYRAVFDAPGLAFHPGYRHQYADTEMFATAAAQRTLARAMTSCVEHLHPIWRSGNALPDDDTYRAAQAADVWSHDTALWQQRLAAIEAHFGVRFQR